jgi:hypothetical protein
MKKNPLNLFYIFVVTAVILYGLVGCKEAQSLSITGLRIVPYDGNSYIDRDSHADTVSLNQIGNSGRIEAMFSIDTTGIWGTTYETYVWYKNNEIWGSQTSREISCSDLTVGDQIKVKVYSEFSEGPSNTAISPTTTIVN